MPEDTIHQPVLLEESIQGLAIKPDGIYIDGTFGRGGHSREILKKLSRKGRLLILDKDPHAIAYAEHYFLEDPRVVIIHDSFAHVLSITQSRNIDGHIAGIILDLGVSSPQLDDPLRGFSFMKQGPLDMRMNTSQSFDASELINTGTEKHLTAIFKEYGEERFAARIAKAIVIARTHTKINTTDALAEIVKKAHPKWEKSKHPATKVFQAIRIYVNQELEDLQAFLKNALDTLTVGGRLVIISFHSLEDRLVKQFMREKEIGIQLPSEIPIRSYKQCMVYLKRVGKAVKPTPLEIQKNVRARSAILRIGEKIA